MNKMTSTLSIIFLLSLILKEDLESKEIKLLSYQSVYEITLDKDRKIKNTFGQQERQKDEYKNNGRF